MCRAPRRLAAAMALSTGFLWAAPVVAQIRTPIATSVSLTPGPAPTNLRVASVTATSVSLAWDAMSGARSYLVTRIKTSDPACCQALSGALVSPGWQDASLQPQTEYTFSVAVSYTDGRSGSTTIAATTPAMAPRTITLPGFTARGTFVTVAPRTLTLSGFTARGTFVTVAPRTLTLSGFTARGTFVAVAPRTLTLSGFTARGTFAAVAPRTITTPGWTAVGPRKLRGDTR